MLLGIATVQTDTNMPATDNNTRDSLEGSITPEANAYAQSKAQLLSRMHKTKGARFAAHDRLSKRHYANGYTVSILSFYVICISVGLLIYSKEIDPSLANILTFTSVALSVLIIIISLLVASEKYDVKSTLMHFCGREVLDLYTELKFKEVDSSQLEVYRKKYQDIINKYPDNHDELDRKLYLKAENQIKGADYWITNLMYIWNIWGINAIYMTLPIWIILAWVWLSVPSQSG